MIDRRDIVLGLGCLAAAGGAYGLRPRRAVSLLKGRKLAEIVPAKFGSWASQDISDPLELDPDSLSARLYNQIVTRLYVDASTGAEVIVLLAHGERQTDGLQLHRPEVCYPAFGYTLMSNRPGEVDLGEGKAIHVRRIMAKLDDRDEAVIYWTRIGEMIPSTGAEQREARFELSLKGVIPDGILCRFSMNTEEGEAVWPKLSGIVRGLVTAVAPDAREVLLGALARRAA